MIKVNLTNQIIENAKKMERETLENLSKTPNYTGFSTPDRFFVGYLGELSFEQLLKENGKKFVYEPNCNGKSQGTDFIVYAHRPLTIEIKSSNHPEAKNLLINQSQFNHRVFDLYVGIKLEENTSYIHGYCSPKAFDFAPEGFNDKKLPTYFMLYKNLFPIEALLPKLS